MKKLILLLSIFLVGCTKEYSIYSNGSYIPENKKAEYAEFIQKTVSAASYRMTTSDYEDPEDVIREAKRTANELYGKPTYGLVICTAFDCFNRVYKTNYGSMTTEERHIFDSLLRYVQ